MSVGDCNDNLSTSIMPINNSDVIANSPKRILVADDEHLVATGICASLTDLGYQVIGPTADGNETIKLCEREKPDLALLDIRMPKMNGLEAAKTIFKQFGLPVMILSAYSDPEYVSIAAEIGVFGFLLKPASQDHLRVSIEVAWRRYQDYINQGFEIGSLKQRLNDRKTIEQAKWFIVQRKGNTEPEAMKMLQKQARNTRRTLIEVANSILDNVEIFAEN